MKKILSILTIAILLAVPAMAGNGRCAGGNGRGSALSSTYYDVTQETTINATVIGYDTVYPSRLLVTTEDSEQLAVFMAPKWYLAQQNITFAEGQAITIIGVLTTFPDSTQGIIARQIVSGDSLYEFRDENGIPLWVSTRGMAGRRGGRGGHGAAAYGNVSPCGNLASIVSSLPVQELNDTEIEILEKMRQEEKLARDVYLTLYEKWGLRVFTNIAQSEQSHMDAVKVLLDKYGLEDPAADNVIGVFKDQVFTDLYNSLVEKGSASLTEALKVGATIEDLDIKDLEDEIALTDNEDIKMVFQNLWKGSRNHLRSFYSLIVANGETYEPQYISQEEFDAIVNSPKERGFILDADGNVYSTCGR